MNMLSLQTCFLQQKSWNQPNRSLFEVPCCIAAQKCGDAPTDNRNIGNLKFEGLRNAFAR
jgi:hypothetical protein